MTADRFSGVLVPVATPFGDDLTPDAERLARLCRLLLEDGAGGLAVFGTTSEANSLSAGERMALLDHLIELRQRLLWSVVAVFVCFIVCFIFATDIYNILLHPYRIAVGAEHLSQHPLSVLLLEAPGALQKQDGSRGIGDDACTGLGPPCDILDPLRRGRDLAL